MTDPIGPAEDELAAQDVDGVDDAVDAEAAEAAGEPTIETEAAEEPTVDPTDTGPRTVGRLVADARSSLDRSSLARTTSTQPLVR